WQKAVEDWQWRTKKVGVIGSGSSVIQTVAALQPHVGRMVQFVRGKTWVSPPFTRQKLGELLQRDTDAENFEFSQADKEAFKDEEVYKQFRHELESALQSDHCVTLRGSTRQTKARQELTENMRKKLWKKPWILDHLLPDFGVSCRRLTPGPGYLEVFSQMPFVPKDIRRITPRGIETVDGKHIDVDVIICATGFDISFHLDFSITGRGGLSIQEKWTPHPSTYLSMCTDGFPNWFMAFGPNSVLAAGSLLILLERQVEYAVAAMKKMQRERLKSIKVKKEAVRDFDEYLENYFPKTVFSEKCRSWYKMGTEDGRIVGLWPGSSLHGLRVLEHPRWEDFNYESADGVHNRFYWLGDGQTCNEKTMTGDRAWYLNDNEVDIPPSECP
ncbi:uncharacterized protein LAESUDRAFT_662540, partial [Laetiporus sulphureus 93-53]